MKRILTPLTALLITYSGLAQDGPFSFNNKTTIFNGNSLHWDATQDANTNLIWSSWSDRYFKINGATFRQSGYVGIGTTSPTYKFEIRSTSDSPLTYIRQDKNAGGSSDVFYLRDDRGYAGENTGTTFKVESWRGASVTNGGILANFITINNGVSTSRLLIDNTTGNVGIGTNSNPLRGKLDVDGPGDIYLVDDVNTGTGQSLFLPGHIYISPYNGGNVSYLQARRYDNSGTTSLRLRTFNAGSLTEAVHIEGNGKVGIGTTSPQEKLHVEGNIYLGTNQLQFLSASGGNNRIQSAGGSVFGTWVFKSRFDHIILDAGENTGNERKIFFRTAGSDRMMVDSYGNVGIGTTNPTQKLEVNGTIYSKEVKVDLSAGAGPDYVFEPNYKLLSLEEIKSYIDLHKHLPEVPSAKEMETNGVNVSEMNMLLLKKIEELTLYQIEATKQIENLKAKVSQLESKINN